MADDDKSMRIEALEERVAFQEHTLQKLDDAMADQQQQLMSLERKISMLMEQLRKVESSLPQSDGDERPPHY
jgi:SlyX protein